MEQQIIIFLQQGGNAFWDAFFAVVSHIASYIGAICLFFVIFLFVSKKIAVVFGGGYLFSVGINFVLKVIINRPRPYQVNDQIINKLSATGQSFPSGHMVSVVFMTAVVLFLLWHLYKNGKVKAFSKPYIKILTIFIAVAIILLTAIARMYLGQHYLSDIIGGIVVGGLGFAITYFVLKMIEKKSNKC